MDNICIIMATYNGEEFLEDQITSILENTYRDFVLHIYDDGSTDRTLEIIRSFAEQYPSQVVCHQNRANKGVILNFLQAVEELDADYYMLCDQDDIWLKRKIEKTLNYIRTLEDPARKLPVVVFGDAKVVNENLSVQADSFQKQSKYHPEHTDLAHLLMENKLLGCTIMFNRALKKKLYRFPPQIRMHDWWLGLVGTVFGTVGYLNEPLLLYRQHGTNIIGNPSYKDYIKNRTAQIERLQDILYRTCNQAEAFLALYEEELSKEQRTILHAFVTLPEQNWFVRRFRIIKYGFYKSGLIRNIGVLLVI